MTGLSTDTFSNLGGAVQDLFGGFADFTKGAGAAAEAKQYGMAEKLAKQNAEFEQESTAIRVMQQDRTTYQMTGGAQADVAAAGFSNSGSSLDILRSNAQQGALASAVLEKQGAITTAGYQEQAKSYGIMQKAAKAQESSDFLGGIGSFLGGALKGAAAVAPLLL